jgi:hypothetical protein
MRFAVDRVALGKVFLEYFGFSCRYHSTNAAYSSSSTVHVALREGQTSVGWEPSKKRLSFGTRGALYVKVFLFRL